MFVQQLIASLKWIRKYIRAYTLLRLVPEMGNGRLHLSLLWNREGSYET